LVIRSTKKLIRLFGYLVIDDRYSLFVFASSINGYRLTIFVVLYLLFGQRSTVNGQRYSFFVFRFCFFGQRSTDSGQHFLSFIYWSNIFSLNLQLTTFSSYNFLNLQPSHFSLYFFPLMVKSNKKDQACIVLS
jgi:hypothetical protein